jgi:hypothetical protein
VSPIVPFVPVATTDLFLGSDRSRVDATNFADGETVCIACCQGVVLNKVNKG